VNTQFKFVTLENSNKYVISMSKEFYRNKSRHFIFRTEDQMEDLFRAAIKKGIIEKIKDNGSALILFDYKNRKLALVVNILSNPEKKTTTIIKINYLLSQSHNNFKKIYNACPPENIVTMGDYVLPVRIVVRDFIDIYFDTFFICKDKVDVYLSNYIYKNKKSFLEEYIVNNILQKIAGSIFSESCNIVNLENILDKEPFWIWLKEETLEDEDNYYTVDDKDIFLCCLSLVKKQKNKKVFYELLLDQVYKNPIKQKVEEIKQYRETLFEEPILIQKKVTKIKIARKVNRKGLKIVKKGSAHV